MFIIVSCTMLILFSYRQQSSIPFTSVETLYRFFPTGSFAELTLYLTMLLYTVTSSPCIRDGMPNKFKECSYPSNCAAILYSST